MWLPLVNLNSAQHIIRKLVSFRENGMHWLIQRRLYKDWDDYESLSGQVITRKRDVLTYYIALPVILRHYVPR